jgi:hypothetical protein
MEFPWHNPVGEGDLMCLTIFAPPYTASDDEQLLPTGTFTIGGMRREGTALWGGWDNRAETYTGAWGSWYIDYNDLMSYPDRPQPPMAALTKGTITIDYNSETEIYNIVVDAFSDYREPVRVDFEGPIKLDISQINFE